MLRPVWKAGAVFLVLYSSLVAWDVVVYNRSLAAQVPGLVEEFGDEYRDYMKRTKRLIPLIY